MTPQERLIQTLEAEIGYLEKASNSQLDSKTANAGSGNYTKYARDLDAIPGFYNYPKQGQAWCDIFHDWCMVQTFGVELAKKMMYHNQYGAGCIESANAYKVAGALYSKPQIGDQAFFGTTKIIHTGTVVAINNGIVYTIEGNTNDKKGVIPNGGMVCKKEHSYYDTTIKYGRPNFSLAEDIMTQEEFNMMADNWIKSIQSLGASDYAKEASKKAIVAGIFADGDKDGLIDYPQAPLKRQELAVVLNRIGLLDEKK